MGQPSSVTCLGGWRSFAGSKSLWPGGITYGSILAWMNIHFGTYFDLYQGYRVLAQSHILIKKTPSVSPEWMVWIGDFGIWVERQVLAEVKGKPPGQT